jgi:mono/diheme cytochrome c family protein
VKLLASYLTESGEPRSQFEIIFRGPSSYNPNLMALVAGSRVACSAIVVSVLLCDIAAPRAEAGQQIAAPASPPSASQPTPATGAGNADAGRETYMKKGCYACHGREGQGSPTAGPRLGPNPTALSAFTRFVRAPRGTMPPYTEKVVTDRELADIHAFLQARPPAASIDSVLPPK